MRLRICRILPVNDWTTCVGFEVFLENKKLFENIENFYFSCEMKFWLVKDPRNEKLKTFKFRLRLQSHGKWVGKHTFHFIKASKKENFREKKNSAHMKDSQPFFESQSLMLFLTIFATLLESKGRYYSHVSCRSIALYFFLLLHLTWNESFPLWDYQWLSSGRHSSLNVIWAMKIIVSSFIVHTTSGH